MTRKMSCTRTGFCCDISTHSEFTTRSVSIVQSSSSGGASPKSVSQCTSTRLVTTLKRSMTRSDRNCWMSSTVAYTSCQFAFRSVRSVLFAFFLRFFSSIFHQTSYILKFLHKEFQSFLRPHRIHAYLLLPQQCIV